MKGKFWINPFLDNFYEWGVGKYWEDKLSFLKFLDETLESPREGSYSHTSSTIMPVKVKEYIKEKVPEWYWKNGFSMNIGQGVDGEENSYYDSILKAWESGEPFRYDSQDEWNFRETEEMPEDYIENAQDYVGYPEYLKSDGHMFPIGSFPGYVVIFKLSGKRQHWLYNSLYFTTEKGKSWCGVSPISKFLNWINENPFEVK